MDMQLKIFTLLLITYGILAVADQSPMELVSEVSPNSLEIDNSKLDSQIKNGERYLNRHKIVKLNVVALDTDHRTALPEGTDESQGWMVGNTVKFTAFDNETLLLKNTNIERTKGEAAEGYSDWWTWVGRVEGDASSFVSFVVANNQIQGGLISSPDYGTYELSTINDDFMLIKHFKSVHEYNLQKTATDPTFEQDTRRRPEFDDHFDDTRQELKKNNNETRLMGGTSEWIAVSGFIAQSYGSSEASAAATIQSAIAYANGALSASGSTAQFYWSGTVYRVYTINEGSDTVDFIDAMVPDKHEAVRLLRNKAGADVMVGLASFSSGPCARTYLPGQMGSKVAGYIATSDGTLDGCDNLQLPFVIAHELGHLLGGDHATVANGATFPQSRAWIPAGPTGEKTIVASPVECNDCTYVQQYSHNGTSWGDATHDNIYAFNILSPYVEDYRGTPATVSTPNQGFVFTQLDCQVVTASWAEPSTQPSVYKVDVDFSHYEDTGLNNTKVFFLTGGWHYITVKPCLGNQCDSTPTVRSVFITLPCNPQ